MAAIATFDVSRLFKKTGNRVSAKDVAKMWVILISE